MRIAVYANKRAAHQVENCRAFYKGLARHGTAAQFIAYDGVAIPATADLHVFWSLKLSRQVQFHGRNFLVLERGYIDRMNYTSISFNGLHGRSLLDFSEAGNSRVWRKGWKMAEEKTGGDKTVIMGQVPGDAALYGLDIHAWARNKAALLRDLRKEPYFRPHPQWPVTLPGVKTLEGTLEEALAQTKCALTYTSNAAVDCWLAGVRCHADNNGSMIHRWQDYNGRCRDPYKWLNDLSFKQYNIQEMESGLAWENIAPQILQYFSGKAACLTG